MPSETRQGGKTPGTFRVLVVDDSPTIRRHVVQKLEPMGFHVTEASSGEEALDLTLGHTFDIVVSDIEMGGITGVQLCRVFRGDPGMKDIAFVLLTAAKDAKTRFWGRNAGADVLPSITHTSLQRCVRNPAAPMGVRDAPSLDANRVRHRSIQCYVCSEPAPHASGAPVLRDGRDAAVTSGRHPQ